jgi:hypothetical protein
MVAMPIVPHNLSQLRQERPTVSRMLPGHSGGRGAGVLAGEGLRVLLFAGLRNDFPGLGPQLVIDATRLDVEPVAGDAELRPVLYRRPSARFQLRERAGSHRADRVRTGRQYPVRNPGAHDAFASAVTRGRGHEDRHHRIDAVESPRGDLLAEAVLFGAFLSQPHSADRA